MHHSGKDDGLDGTFEPWSVNKSAILSKYTTSEKLSITTSFLSAGEAKDKGIVVLDILKIFLFPPGSTSWAHRYHLG